MMDLEILTQSRKDAKIFCNFLFVSLRLCANQKRAKAHV